MHTPILQGLAKSRLLKFGSHALVEVVRLEPWAPTMEPLFAKEGVNLVWGVPRMQIMIV